jgi:methanogenic corrinoid protein MtbC1
LNLHQRKAIAGTICGRRDSLATVVNTEFFERHPDWRQRYGERGVKRGYEDACFHIDFLCGAIETGSLGAFEDYARWTANVLQARGIARQFVQENLQQVGNALQTVLSGAELAYAEEFIRAGMAVCGNSSPRVKDPTSEEQGELALTRRLLTRALVQGQRKAALTLVTEALDNGAALLDVYVDLLQSAQFEIGRLWEANVITVAQEHMATAITQYVMAHLYPRADRPATSKGKIVVTGVEGEYHHVGPNIIADVLEADGWDVRFLGANVPHVGILRVIEEHEASVAGISVTLLSNMPQLIRLIESIDQKFGHRKVGIIVGGAGFRSNPELWREIGADGFAVDARHALAVVNALRR